MFWQSKQVSSPHLEALLNKEDVTIYELMDDEDILQECKSQNKKLLDYLTRPNVMDELVTLTTQDPSTELAERQRYKYPNIACELLTCDVPVLNEKLAGDEGLLLKLYSFIDTEEPLNPLLASFFSKTIGVLVGRATDQNWYSYQFTCLQVLEFLKGRQRCIDLLLHHLETSAIMDLVLKLVTQIEGSEMRQNILNWLDSQQLVQRLIKLLSPVTEPSRHSNAAELLSDMITAARDIRKNSTERTDPDPILCTLESEETITLILETILSDVKVETSIVGGIQVLLALLRPKINGISNEGNGSSSNSLEDAAENEQRIRISNAIIPFLERLNQLLLNPPYTPAVKTTIGILESPVGNTRLHVLKLFATLLATENPKVREKLAELDMFEILLDLFFKYSWNNFLHTQVQQCLGMALNYSCPENDVDFYDYLFVKCRLIDRILEAYAVNEDKQNGGVRQGYMGHLIEIANNIASQCEKNNALDNFLKTKLPQEMLEKWENLVSCHLQTINKTQQTLASQMQQYMTGLDGNISEYDSYSQDSYAQQSQNMGTQYIENYGVRDEMYNDGEDNALFNSGGDQSNSNTFTFNEEDQSKREEMFMKLYHYNEKSEPDDEENEESHASANWSTDVHSMDESIFPPMESAIYQRDWSYSNPKKKTSRSSSSEEEEDDNEKEDGRAQMKSNMDIDDVDPWDSWSTTNSYPNTVLQSVNPWEENTSTQQQSEGWANFDNFENAFGTNWKNEEESNLPGTVIASSVGDGPIQKTDFSIQLPEQASWANFANFETALTITGDGEGEIAGKSDDIKEVSSGSGDQVNRGNLNSDVAKEGEIKAQSVKQSPQSIKSSDDDNANPIVMIENRISETTGSDKDTSEIVQNTVDSVKSSSDSSTFANAIENVAVAAEDPQ